MKIYPQDLSTKLYRRVLESRLNGRTVSNGVGIDRVCEYHAQWRSSTDVPMRRDYVSGLSRYLYKPGSVWSMVAGILLTMVIGATMPIVAFWEVRPLLLVLVIGLLYACFATVRPVYRFFRRLVFEPWLTTSHKELTAAEMADVTANSPGLGDVYWPLLSMVAEVKSEHPEIGEDVDKAMAAIDEVVDSLLPRMPAFRDREPGSICVDAVAVERGADAEADPVVRASLRRQADALRTGAALLERVAIIQRRNDVLEQEVVAQIRAMHAGLEHYRQGADDDGRDRMLSLADNIRNLAVQASSNMAAREEVRAAIDSEPATFKLQNINT